MEYYLFAGHRLARRISPFKYEWLSRKKIVTLARAIEIAVSAHKWQRDKSGAEYILHPLRVMDRGKTEVEKICGVLHDVVEDSDWTFAALEKEGFSSEVIDILRCVTKTSE